jgi:D-psicose/D-tagatose/L-ribulose 3-epimerase
MKQSYGFSCFDMTGGLSRPDFFAAAAGAGFGHLEISSEPGHLNDWLESPEETRTQAHEHGVSIVSVHSPVAGWRNNLKDENKRRESIQATISCLAPARAVGAQVVVVHPTCNQVPLTPENLEGNRKRAMDSLKELADAAGKVGIRLAVENLPARGNCRPGALISDVLEMIEGLGDHVGVCIDAGHSNSNGQDPAAEARLAGQRIFDVHIQDNDGRGQDQHLIPGQGTTDWKSFLKALDEVNYEGGRMFEIPEDRAGGFQQTLTALAQLKNEWEK